MEFVLRARLIGRAALTRASVALEFAVHAFVAAPEFVVSEFVGFAFVAAPLFVAFVEPLDVFVLCAEVAEAGPLVAPRGD